ncbi:MAG: NAD-dependent epimerase/dehydratase family protein [Magnetococcus sp. DMHC-8]
MKVAVTGAGGFIGRHVVAELLARAVPVMAVARAAGPLRAQWPAIQVVTMDIARPSPTAYLDLGSPEVLIHLAWGGLPNYRSLHHFEEELVRQYRFLRGLLEAGLPALVVAGTCFEYGMRCGACSEEMAPRPANPYAYAKDALHKQLTYLRMTHPFALTWARLFYTYGEGQMPGSLYPALQAAVNRGDAVFNMSGGEQLRDYLPVTTVAARLADLALQHADAGVINVCAGQPVAVRSLVEGWLREWGKEITLNLGYYPYPDYEPMAFWGDSKRWGQLTG